MLAGPRFSTFGFLTDCTFIGGSLALLGGLQLETCSFHLARRFILFLVIRLSLRLLIRTFLFRVCKLKEIDNMKNKNNIKVEEIFFKTIHHSKRAEKATFSLVSKGRISLTKNN